MLERVGASLLTGAGLRNWVAHDEDEFVHLAIKHAGDAAILAQLRSELRPRLAKTALFSAEKFSSHFEQAMFGIWRRVLKKTS